MIDTNTSCNADYSNPLLIRMIVEKNKCLERSMIQGVDRLLLSILLTSLIKGGGLFVC